MNFRPANPNRHLWDTWFYDHNGEYHLFYLSNQIADDGRWIPWDAFSLATSRDLLHWEEKGEVFHKSDNPADWDSELITTGDIIRWRGRWYMTYRATQDRVEKNNIIVSDDLLNWQRISPSPVLVTSEPYEHDPAQTINNYVEMRDVTITELPDGTLEGVFTARVASGPHTGRGVLARAYSADMLHWRMGEPLFAPGRFNVIEVPSRFRHGGPHQGTRHYLLFCVNSHLESALENRNYPSMTWCTGYAVSDRFDGGFDYVPEQVLGIGDAYVGRLVRAGGETLFFQHLCGRRPAFALPKSVCFMEDGTIRLGYWRGVDALIRGEAVRGFSNLRFFEDGGKTVCSGTIAPEACTLENAAEFGDAYLPGTFSDFVLDVDIAFDRCLSAGVVLNADVPSRGAVMATFRADRGAFQVGRSRKVYNHLAPNGVRHEYLNDALKAGRVHLKVVSRSEGFDWYLDGVHVLTTLDDDLISGQIGFFVREGTARFSNLVITELEPEDCPNLR